MISPLAHARFLHGSGKGYLTVAAKGTPRGSSGGFEHLHSGPFEKLADVLPAYGGMQDVYVTQNRFYGLRRIL